MFCGFWFYGIVAAYVLDYVSSRAIANLIGFFVIFAGVLVLGAIVGHILAKFFKWAGLSWFDRLLGGAFGFVRGLSSRSRWSPCWWPLRRRPRRTRWWTPSCCPIREHLRYSGRHDAARNQGLFPRDQGKVREALVRPSRRKLPNRSRHE